MDKVPLIDLMFTVTEESYTASLFQNVFLARACLSVSALLPSLESFLFFVSSKFVFSF